MLSFQLLLFWFVVAFTDAEIDYPEFPSKVRLMKSSQYLSITNLEIDVLFDLYNSTSGWNWTWATGSQAAPKWSFNKSQQEDPCATYSESTSSIMAWQGITCSASPAICYTDGAMCTIINITLENYRVLF